MHPMSDREILDEPFRVVLLGLAFIAAVFLPARYHQWPLLGLGFVIAAAGCYLAWRKRRDARRRPQ
jgi:hypothetical protein